MIACYRKIHDWSLEAIITESVSPMFMNRLDWTDVCRYRKFAGEKYRLLDEKFITMFDARPMLAKLRPVMLPTPPQSEKDYDAE